MAKLGRKITQYFTRKTPEKAEPASFDAKPDFGAITDAEFAQAGEGEVVHYCMNCSAPLEGQFCHKCGQTDKELRRPFWSLIADLLEDVFSFDSRLFRTLFPLIFLPGNLTRQFIDGKRARFVSPIRLYIVASILFFLTLALTDTAILKIEAFPQNPDEIAEEVDEANERLRETALELLAGGEEEKAALAGLIRAGTIDVSDVRRSISNPDQLAEFDSILEELGIAIPDGSNQVIDETEEESQTANETEDSDINIDVNVEMFVDAEPSPGSVSLPMDRLQSAIDSIERSKEENPDMGSVSIWILNRVERAISGLARASQEPRALNSALNNWLPRVMIIMVPFFAVLMRMLYWSRRQYLFNMLVFSLHFHTYIFFVMTFFVLAQVVLGSGASAFLFAAAVPLYLLMAMKVVTGQGVIRSFFKFLLLSFIYGLLLFFMVVIAVLLGLSEI